VGAAFAEADAPGFDSVVLSAFSQAASDNAPARNNDVDQSVR
jgi:hypothetical protein